MNLPATISPGSRLYEHTARPCRTSEAWRTEPEEVLTLGTELLVRKLAVARRAAQPYARQLQREAREDMFQIRTHDL